jgi:hypothetical protein
MVENKILILASLIGLVGCHATYNSNNGWGNHEYAYVTNESTKICKTFSRGYHTKCMECYSTVQQQEDPEIICNKIYWRIY